MASSANCKVCGHKNSFDVSKCRSCGENNPHPSGVVFVHNLKQFMVLGVILVLIVMFLESL